MTSGYSKYKGVILGLTPGCLPYEVGVPEDGMRDDGARCLRRPAAQAGSTSGGGPGPPQLRRSNPVHVWMGRSHAWIGATARMGAAARMGGPGREMGRSTDWHWWDVHPVERMILRSTSWNARLIVWEKKGSWENEGGPDRFSACHPLPVALSPGSA